MSMIDLDPTRIISLKHRLEGGGREVSQSPLGYRVPQQKIDEQNLALERLGLAPNIVPNIVMNGDEYLHNEMKPEYRLEDKYPLARLGTPAGWNPGEPTQQWVDPEAEELLGKGPVQPSAEDASTPEPQPESTQESSGERMADAMMDEVDAGNPDLVTWTARMYEAYNKYANADPTRALDQSMAIGQNYRQRLASGPLLAANGNYTQRLGE